MIIDSTAGELAGEEPLRRFIAGFEDGSIPLDYWTHASHVAMAGAYILDLGREAALDRVRDGIRNFNRSHAVVETPTRGYHETLTRFWVQVCDAFLNENGLTGPEAVRALVAVFGRRSGLYREYYSYDLVVCPRARAGWRAPDLQPLPAAWRRRDLMISTNPLLLHIPTVQAFLAQSYWARGIPLDVVERSIRGSVPFGLYDAARQVGFARVVTDLATYGYLADVFVVESHRGRGLARWLMECVMGHPSLAGFRRWQLATMDAHGLYEQAGFRHAAHPERMMEIVNENVYQG
jgi:GNAT superfamily N-acetyltransferase